MLARRNSLDQFNRLFQPLYSWDKDLWQGEFNRGKEEDTFSLNLPGYSRDDINVEVENGILRISARKETSGINRSFTLSDSYDEEGIKAKMEYGVLSITLPIHKDKRARQIPVD